MSKETVIPLEGKTMANFRKTTSAVIASSILAFSLTSATPAAAWGYGYNNGGAAVGALVGGMALGAMVGALASQPHYGYGSNYYAPPPPPPGYYGYHPHRHYYEEWE